MHFKNYKQQQQRQQQQRQQQQRQQQQLELQYKNGQRSYCNLKTK